MSETYGGYTIEELRDRYASRGDIETATRARWKLAIGRAFPDLLAAVERPADPRGWRKFLEDFVALDDCEAHIEDAFERLLPRAHALLALSPAPPRGWQEDEVMRMWRRCGLPEYFLGNGGSNHRLTAFARMCAALSPPAPKDGE